MTPYPKLPPAHSWAALLAAALLVPAAQAQPLVTVPAACNVVVAGTGGTTGPGGKVGDGGIVTMPDPYAGGYFTFSGAPGPVWSLLGDLSYYTTNVPPTPPLQGSTSITTVIILSYNKILRASEIGTPSTLARSKGRVTVAYTQGTCNNKMSFDVYKVWGDPPVYTAPHSRYVPPIVGPNCWGQPPFTAPNHLITFSVDQVSSDNPLDAIGFDQYYWDITNAWGNQLPDAAFYTSADRSSITIDQTTLAFKNWRDEGGPYFMLVSFGRANAWDGGTNLGRAGGWGNTFAFKSIETPLTPTYSGTGFPTCVEVSPTLPITITSSNPNPYYTYTWSRSNTAWPLTPSGSYGSGLTIASIGDMNPCTYFLTLTGPCESRVYSYHIDRSYNSAAVLLAPGSPYCTATGTNVLTVSMAGTAQGNTTCWGSLPAGWSASNPPGIPSAVRFTIPAGAAGTTATVNLFSCACTTPVLPITINVRPGTPVLSASPVCVPSGGGANQTWTATSAGAGATSYTWGNTMGMTEVAPTNDATGVFTPTGTANGNISVYTANVPTCPSITTTKTVNRAAVAPIVVQPSCYTLGYNCAGVPGLPGTASFTINAANYSQNGSGTYMWTFPANTFFNGTGTTAIVTQSTNAAVVRNTTGVPNSGVSGYYRFTVSFAPSTGCASASTTVTANGNLGAATYTNNGTGSGTVGNLYPPPGLPAGSTYMAYDCSIPGTYGAVYSIGSIPLNTPIPAKSGVLTLQITVPGGCTWQPDTLWTSHKRMVVVDEAGEEVVPGRDAQEGIVVIPNPNDGTFVLDLQREFINGTVTLLDAGGKQSGPPAHIMQGPNALRFADLAPGLYTLRIELDGAPHVQRIVVTDGR